MSTGSTLNNLQINTLSHEGRGITKSDGKTTFVFNALPGETVTAKVVHKKRQYLEAEATSIEKASVERVNPRCEVFGVCGGCAMQHLAHDKQLLHKENVLLEQLKHFGQAIPKQILPALAGPIWGYRHKARLGIRNVIKKGGVLVGFRERNGRFLVDMKNCPVLHPAIGEKIHLWRTFLSTLEAKETIPQMEVAVSDNETAVIIRHLEPLTEADQLQLIEFAKMHAYRLYLQPKGPDSIHLVYPSQQKPLRYQIPKHGLIIEFAPNDFTQVNRELNLLMLDQALDLLDLKPTDTVLDLFCGLGNFTLPIAKYAHYVLGLEADVPMVLKAEHNAKLNQLSNTQFAKADLFSQEIHSLQLDNYGFNKVLLDPPRAGAEKMCHEIARLNINHVVYVSCNPATLARDVGILVNEYGYTLQKAGVMDMFPHTAHVEAMALLTRA